MEKFMYLFRGGMSNTTSQEALDASMKEWMSWIDKLRKNGKYVAGEPLLPHGKTISGKKQTLTDGPFTEGKELVGGFFIVNAKDYNEAVEMAKECPDFKLDGSVEIRQVMKM